MKAKIPAFIVLFLMAVGVNAQIDRSVMPKPGPAPKITLEVPDEFELKNGIKVLVVENHKLPRVSYTLTIDNKPITEGKKAGVSSLLSAMLGNGTTTISKDEFNDEIDFLGASLFFGAQSAYASSLTKYSDRIVELMADAAMNPLLTKEEFEKEKEKLLESLKSEAKSVDAIAGRVGGALSYGKKHPRGEFTTEETVNNVEFGDVLAFYEKYFNPNNAYIVVVGDVKSRDVKKQLSKYFGKWEEAAGVDVTIPEPAPNAQYTQINFVDMPNAVQSNISLTNNVDLKMNDEDYHSVLIANKILGGGFNSYLNMNLREEHGYTYGARSNVGTSRWNASRFTAGASVRNAVTDSAVVETLKEINRIKTEPVETDALTNAKAKYVGDFVLALERPQTIANYALNIKLNDLPKDFYSTYLEKINAVTKEDVQRVANKYFKTENARVIVVGKGSEVLENLEKTGIPIKYYDTYAEPTEKPVFSKPIPEGVTAQSVIKGYIAAVGGEDNLKNVNTVLMNADVTIPGAPYKPTAVMKQMAPNKSSMELMIEGMGTVMKQNFDGENGYQEGQGQKIPMGETEVNSRKEEKGLYPELYIDASTITLESVATIEGKDVYKISVANSDGPADVRYYDVETGFLVRTEETSEASGQSIVTVTDFSDYKEVNGVMMPNTMKVTTGPQSFEFNMTDIKINEGVTEEDFK
ncbi:insulinase family protein [Winogradskyella sp. SYSU M77433]|uniref:insulinase family protein n=1 Tax=Winogradskyella sp. SYSU M77433 TaxID=3042722 RepID=UPI002480ED93|nr:insulinase family protein [Winogradskyella sp. SYSU M77433]MDH7913524.1 insulinase family protein [Winogradskyella sp. SYSU M77433]